MRNLVKTTVLGLGLLVTMSSCTKDNQEMIELSEKKEVIPIEKTPIKDTPIEDKELPLPIELLPDVQPTPTKEYNPKKTPLPTELTPADDFENQSSSTKEYVGKKSSKLNTSSSKQKNRTTFKKMNLKKVPDMSIVRETPFIDSSEYQLLSPKNK